MRNILLFVFFISLLSSCGPQKKVLYFQDLEKSIQGQLTNEKINYSLTIQTDDELSIVVSAANPAAAAPYNLPLVSTQTSGLQTPEGRQASLSLSASGNQTLQTYLVNSDGYINFPGIGKIKVAGMNRDELTVKLEELLSEYITNPIINIQIVNFRISVLGEVAAPGSYNFNKQRVSILEALAAARDVTLQGRRDNIFIARDINGKKEFYRIDLSSSDTFKSSNYYLQQNDVVYVAPNRERQRDADFGIQKQFNTSIIISAISTLISIVAIVTR